VNKARNEFDVNHDKAIKRLDWSSLKAISEPLKEFPEFFSINEKKKGSKILNDVAPENNLPKKKLYIK